MKNPQPDAFEADLKAFLDGELPIMRRFQVRRHLNHCPACREGIRIMQTIQEELKEETAPLEADLRAKILENAPALPSAPKSSAPPKPVQVPRRLRRQLALGGAAALLVAAVAAPHFNRQSEDAPRSAVQSNLKQIPLGAIQSAQSDAKVSAGNAPPPSAGPVAAGAATSTSSAADVLRSSGQFQRGEKGAQRRAMTNGIFGDGHVKNEAGAASSPVYRDSGQALSGYGSEVTLDSRAVHKEGSVTIAVADAEKSGEAVEQVVKNAGGFVASNSLATGAGETRSATLDCRIPVEKFEVVTQKVGALGSVRAKTLNGEDITARIAAAAARKTTLSREFSVASAQLQQKEKTAKKRDAQSLYYARLEVRNLRLQAAQSRAAFETLRRFSALSSLYVTVQDKPKIAPGAGTTGNATGDLGATARAAWSSLLTSARLPVQLLIWILVYAPLWLPALLIWKKWGRKWVAAA